MARILITGGAGFIGYHLSRKLSEDTNNTVVILDNLQRGKLDDDLLMLTSKENVDLVQGDLTEKDVFRDLGKDFDYIYHLAAIIGVQNVMDDPDRVLYVNSVSTFNVLDFAKELEGLKKLVFSSTSEIYAGTLKHFGINVPTDESVPLTVEDIAAERTTYALSKMYGESSCLMYAKKFGLPVSIVRYHNVYGPRMGFSHVIPEMFIKIINNSLVEVFSPSHTRAFCYVDDAIEFTQMVAESKESAGNTYHIGNSSEEIAIIDLVSKIAKVMGKQIDIKESEDTPGSPARRCPEIACVVGLTGYKPTVDLEDGIGKTYQWYESRIW